MHFIGFRPEQRGQAGALLDSAREGEVEEQGPAFAGSEPGDRLTAKEHARRPQQSHLKG
jgi:hypothetical protein